MPCPRFLPCPRCAVPQAVDSARCAACLFRFDTAALGLEIDGVRIHGAFRLLHLFQDKQEIVVPASTAPGVLVAALRMCAWIDELGRQRRTPDSNVVEITSGGSGGIFFGVGKSPAFRERSRQAAERLVHDVTGDGEDEEDP